MALLIPLAGSCSHCSALRRFESRSYVSGNGNQALVDRFQSTFHRLHDPQYWSGYGDNLLRFFSAGFHLWQKVEDMRAFAIFGGDGDVVGIVTTESDDAPFVVVPASARCHLRTTLPVHRHLCGSPRKPAAPRSRRLRAQPRRRRGARPFVARREFAARCAPSIARGQGPCRARSSQRVRRGELPRKRQRARSEPRSRGPAGLLV